MKELIRKKARGRWVKELGGDTWKKKWGLENRHVLRVHGNWHVTMLGLYGLIDVAKFS